MRSIVNNIRNALRKRRINKTNEKLKKYDSVEMLFTDYYTNNVWTGGGQETVSGSGSTLKYTEKLRANLPELFEKYKIQRVFDAPCGDYNWFRHIVSNINYTGGDIVNDLIAKNNTQYANDKTKFIHFDILNDNPPGDYDLWICRDCLLHFSYRHIFEFIDNFKKSEIPYLLVSTYHECNENIDITTGAGRPLNLEIAPFFFPNAVEYIDDSMKGARPRKLGLWFRENIPDKY